MIRFFDISSHKQSNKIQKQFSKCLTHRIKFDFLWPINIFIFLFICIDRFFWKKKNKWLTKFEYFLSNCQILFITICKKFTCFCRSFLFLDYIKISCDMWNFKDFKMYKTHENKPNFAGLNAFLISERINKYSKQNHNLSSK